MSVCKSQWDPPRVENALLKTALKSRCGDLVQRLLTLRQTHLNLDNYLLDVGCHSDRGHLVELLLTTRLTTTVLSAPDRRDERTLSSVTLEALVRHGFLLCGTFPRYSFKQFKTAVQNRDFARLCHYLELHPNLTIHHCIERLSTYLRTENIDETLVTLFDYRSTRQALVSTIRFGRAPIAAAGRGWPIVASAFLTTELSAHTAMYSTCETDEGENCEATLLGSLIACDQTPGNQICKFAIHKLCKPVEVDRYVDSSLSTFVRMNVVRIEIPLLIAAKYGKLDIVKLLSTEYKADINLTPRLGVQRTPLQQAAESGHMHIVRWLLDHGANANGLINQVCGATALQLAAIGGYCGIMETLINAAADLDAPRASFGGRTALEGAAEHGRIDAVNLLLGSGVSITGEGEKNLLSAVQMARENGHESVADFLGDYHIDVSLGNIELGDLGMGDAVFPAVSVS